MLQKTKLYAYSILSLFLIIHFSNNLFAQASLAAEDIINDVVIQYKGRKEAFTVVRDARDKNQWYYIQNAPRITEYTESSDTIPEISLVRYQKKDIQTQKIYEGGILQFGATLQLPAEIISLIKSELISKYKQKNDIRLSALPIKSATVAMYTPLGSNTTENSKLLTTANWGNGIAPTFSSQKMAFAVELSSLGTDVLEALVNGNTGIPIAIIYTYNGLTPKAGFKITVDWEQTFSYYSRADDFRANASYFGLFGASYEQTSQEMYTTLLQNKCIEVEIFTGESLTMNDIEKYLQPILSRINSEMLSNFTPPLTIEPAVANAPTSNGKFFSAGYSVGMKSGSQNKRGKEVFDFNVQQVIERKTIAGGFIGIGNYSESIKKKVVVFANEGPLKTAYILLPSVFSKDDAIKMGVTDITMECQVEGNGKKYGSVARWKASDEKWTADGTTRQDFMLIPLGQFLSVENDITKIKVTNKVTINSENKVIKYSESIEPNDGGFLIGTINKAGYEILTIDPTDISYKKLSSTSNILELQLKIQVGQEIIRKTYKPYRNSDGTFRIPDTDKIIITKQNEGQTYSISIVMNLDNGATKSWKFNGLNNGLPEKFQGGTISLEDFDFN
jgi:hypothetical protein